MSLKYTDTKKYFFTENPVGICCSIRDWDTWQTAILEFSLNHRQRTS